jgi:hypothetical protein
VNCGSWSYFLYISITCLLYSHIITFHSIRSYPLFQANRWDWQPHRKLETKYLVVLCAGSTLPLAKKSLDEAPYKLSGAVARYWASPSVVWLFPLLNDKSWFLTEGKSCCYIDHTFLLGFPTGQSFTRHHRVSSLLLFFLYTCLFDCLWYNDIQSLNIQFWPSSFLIVQTKIGNLETNLLHSI